MKQKLNSKGLETRLKKLARKEKEKEIEHERRIETKI